MTKVYELECPNHGHIKIEVEKPPSKFRYRTYCPFCLEAISERVEDKKKWQPNLISEGVHA